MVRLTSTPPEAAADIVTDTTVHGFFEVAQSVSYVVIRALDLQLAVKEP